MKGIKFFILVMILMSGLTFGGVITVTSPACGSEWCINDNTHPVEIRWNESPKENQLVKIRLYDSTATNQILKITDSTDNNGVYNWTIPPSIPAGQYIIRVRSINNLASGDSAVFTIKDCSRPDPQVCDPIWITRPKKGDYLIAGGSFDIKWMAMGGGELQINKCVNLFLFKGNQQILNITQNRCINGYHWNIPSNLSGTGYKIMLITTDDQHQDYSVKFAILSSKPDLLIGGKMTRTPQHPKVNEFFDFKFRIDNGGNGQAAESDAELTINGPDNFLLVKRISVRSIGGAPDHAYFKKRLRLPRIGIYRFTLKLDIDNAVQENNELNNEKWILVDVNPKQYPDLTITNVNTPDYKKTVGAKCTMNVTIKNAGQAPSGYFELDADLDTCPLIAQGRKYKTHPGLPPGESVTFTFKHRYACFKMVGVKFYVDKANNVKESNENNNKCGLPFHIDIRNVGSAKSPWSSNCN